MDKKYLLLIPSAVIQDELNYYIMNPLHPLSVEAKTIETKPFIFDERLKTKIKLRDEYFSVNWMNFFSIPSTKILYMWLC